MKIGRLLTIDGSFGEGGGQILRSTLALSMITGQGVRIGNIRANRDTPGLRPQHLAALKGAVSISNAEVTGDEIGSQEVQFIPEAVEGGEFSFDIGTAGSVTLLLQCLLPPLVHAKGTSHLRLMGGTDVPWSPPVDYLKYVLVPMLRKMGVDIELKLVRRGYYPRGGGEIQVIVHPSALEPADFQRLTGVDVDTKADESEGISVHGQVFLTDLPDHICSRMIQGAKQELRRGIGRNVGVSIEKCDEHGIGVGTGITLWTAGKGSESPEYILGASSLGKRGVKAEDVGARAARDLIMEMESGCSVDVHAGDQLPVFTALMDYGHTGKRLKYSVREITPHLSTALWVLEQFGHTSTTLFQNGFHITV